MDPLEHRRASGAVSAILALISSRPSTTYRSRHGEPHEGAERKQSSAKSSVRCAIRA